MLFNSRLFILGFLPLAWAGFWLLGGNRKAALTWLLGCSFLFYAWWKPPMLLVLLASIIVNYTIAGLVARKAWLVAGLGFNFGLLGMFKYSGLLGINGIILPLGISFFTFQQIRSEYCKQRIVYRYDNRGHGRTPQIESPFVLPLRF